MFAVKEIYQQFPHTFKYLDATFFLVEAPSDAKRDALCNLVRARRFPGLERVSAPLQGVDDELFAKAQPLDSLKSRIRVTLGRAKSDGMYDWPVEEVLNTVEAYRRGAPITPLAGFGYSKSTLGITQEYFILTELLNEHVNGITWLESAPEQIESFIKLSFSLLRSLHEKQITHMDFWANNVMVNLAPEGEPMAIDLENCFPQTSLYFSETLAFQFGFFYKRDIYRFITEAHYDQLVADELATYTSIDHEAFENVYKLSKYEKIGRKDRREIFLRGTVVTG
ncbi:hypothetical protein AUC61_14015 [Pseudomonas sp. S25]|uniref:Lipopolysaccharide kinase (Kdo/WaaP) family protein n=1 Tax=Pseudomonas maioricensis TaxID=1766623 RepID=A0ABS9ZJ96_9PSED|nr:hypothetical protein [Pseudomonas sp. S25]MCI8210649.1 hypothetical protein [Pseudomonas sp. S25]